MYSLSTAASLWSELSSSLSGLLPATDVHHWCVCSIGLQVKRASSNMAAASYDQLLRQVEVLKMENSNLRQELQDNSNHLTKLETEASNMKVGALRTTHRNGCFT